ncbi:TEA/ATTS domain family-domain-containing protein [Dipodascopsis tothii]|uniref:TEA/ATTS domain family-domain-containing protein n=1 Tax=Dipodascopsis tothii TaxID=44089 RepID=UPI0034CDF23F
MSSPITPRSGPRAALSGLLPSAFTLTPPATVMRKRALDESHDQNAQRPDAAAYKLKLSATPPSSDSEDWRERDGPRAALALATPSATNIQYKRPRLDRSLSTTYVAAYDALVPSSAPPTKTVAPAPALVLDTPVRQSSAPLPESAACGFFQSPTDLPAYNAYLLRQRRENGDESSSIWSKDVEDAFMEAIRKIPKVGRRKITVNGRPCGRNELISDFILRKTGKVRTRKQVSSHIQVLKHLLREDPEFMNLVSESASNTTRSSPEADVSPLYGAHMLKPTHTSPLVAPVAHRDPHVYDPSMVSPLFLKHATQLGLHGAVDGGFFLDSAMPTSSMSSISSASTESSLDLDPLPFDDELAYPHSMLVQPTVLYSSPSRPPTYPPAALQATPELKLARDDLLGSGFSPNPALQPMYVVPPPGYGLWVSNSVSESLAPATSAGLVPSLVADQHFAPALDGSSIGSW